VSGLFVLHGRPGTDATIRTPGYPVTPVIFLVLVALLLILIAGHNPVQAALGVGIVGLGGPVYLLAFRQRLTQPTDGSS
jgi:basic amino acid/polyamine antiporter, APA family